MPSRLHPFPSLQHAEWKSWLCRWYEAYTSLGRGTLVLLPHCPLPVHLLLFLNQQAVTGLSRNSSFCSSQPLPLGSHADWAQRKSARNGLVWQMHGEWCLPREPATSTAKWPHSYHYMSCVCIWTKAGEKRKPTLCSPLPSFHSLLAMSNCRWPLWRTKANKCW